MTTSLYARTFGFGAVSGLRSMTAPAIVRIGARDASSAVLAVLAAGEFIADKLPVTPSRTMPPALILRALAGAYVGSELMDEEGESRALGAALGAAGAIAGAYAGRLLRAQIVKRTRLPDLVVALGEDAVALGLGALLR